MTGKAVACQKAVVLIIKTDRGVDTADVVVDPENALDAVYELIGK